MSEQILLTLIVAAAGILSALSSITAMATRAAVGQFKAEIVQRLADYAEAASGKYVQFPTLAALERRIERIEHEPHRFDRP